MLDEKLALRATLGNNLWRERKYIFGQVYMPGLEPVDLFWQEVWFCLTEEVMSSTSRLIASLWPKIALQL